MFPGTETGGSFQKEEAPPKKSQLALEIGQSSGWEYNINELVALTEAGTTSAEGFLLYSYVYNTNTVSSSCQTTPFTFFQDKDNNASMLQFKLIPLKLRKCIKRIPTML